MVSTRPLLWRGTFGSGLATAAFAVAASMPRLSAESLVVCLIAFIMGLSLVEASLMSAVDRSKDVAWFPDLHNVPGTS